MVDSACQQPRTKPWRRTRRWIAPDLQLSITLMTLSVAVIVLTVNFQVNLLGLSRINNYPPATVVQTLDQFKAALLQDFLFALLLVVPMAIWVGVVYAFRFCGPIYRFRRFFRDLAQGRWDQTCSLRKHDHLHDMKDSINLFLESMTGRLRRQDALLREVRPFLERPAATGHEVERCHEILRQIDEELAETSRRLGGLDPSARPSPAHDTGGAASHHPGRAPAEVLST